MRPLTPEEEELLHLAAPVTPPDQLSPWGVSPRGFTLSSQRAGWWDVGIKTIRGRAPKAVAIKVVSWRREE